MRLRFRNTYKTRKVMGVYGAMSIICLMLFVFLLEGAFVFKSKALFLILSFINLALFFLFFFLLCLENNNYKWKYYYLGKNKKRIKEYCIAMGYSKKEAKRTMAIMIDNYRQTGKIYRKYDLMHLFFKRHDNFDYKSADDNKKLGHIVYYLAKCFDGKFNIAEFGNDVKGMGFTKKEIKGLFNQDWIDEHIKTLISELASAKKFSFLRLYPYETDIYSLMNYLIGDITLSNYQKKSDVIFTAMRHIAYNIETLETGEFCLKKCIAYDMTMRENWQDCGQFKTEQKAREMIAASELDDNKIEAWNFVWRAWSGENLPQKYSDLLSYYSGIEGEGHSLFFDNSLDELERIDASLKETLNATFYDNFKDALIKFKDKKETGENDRFFYDNIEEINKIIINIINFL